MNWRFFKRTLEYVYTLRTLGLLRIFRNGHIYAEVWRFQVFVMFCPYVVCIVIMLWTRNSESVYTLRTIGLLSFVGNGHNYVELWRVQVYVMVCPHVVCIVCTGCEILNMREKMAHSAWVSSTMDVTTSSCETLELLIYLFAQIVTLLTLNGQRSSISVRPRFLSKLLPWYEIGGPFLTYAARSPSRYQRRSFR